MDLRKKRDAVHVHCFTYQKCIAKQRGGSKAREKGDKIQQVARSSMVEEASKLLRKGKNLD